MGNADHDVDVVVAGLGPTGAVLSLLLASAGLRVLVADAATEVFPHPRAVAVDDDVLRILAPLVTVEVNGWQRAGFVNAAGRLLLDVGFGETELGLPALGFLHQPSLESALRKRLATHRNVTVCLGARVALASQDESRVDVAVGEERVRARWLVGCDGASSSIRSGLGIPWQGRDDVHRWLVIDAAVATPLERWPYFRYLCDPLRPAVTMPFPGGHRWEFRLAAGESPDPQALIAPFVAGRNDMQIVRAATYRFGARSAARWRDGRVLLAGDAAHTMPPFAGQGMGAGIRDASQLAWRLAEMCAGSPRETDPLAAWERERRSQLSRVVALSRLLGRIVTTPHARTRDRLLLGAGATPWLGSWLRHGGPRPPSGARLPNPRIRLLDGKLMRLDDHIPQRWQHFSLTGGNGLQVLPLGGRVASTPPEAIEDLDGTLLALLRRHGDAVLARPDRLLAVG